MQNITPTLTELVLAAQAGDRLAFGRLFERFERLVFAIAMRRLRDVDQAQELCQDVFVHALQKIDQLREPQCFGGWLRTIVSRMASNRGPWKSPQQSTDPEKLENVCSGRGSPLSEALSVERDLQVRAGLQRLRTLDRETLVSFYFRGRSLLEMSDDFGAPMGTIKRRLHVARRRMAQEVQPLAVA